MMRRGGMKKLVLDPDIWQEIGDLLNEALLRVDWRSARRVDVYAPGGIKIMLLSLTPNYVRVDIIGGKSEDLTDILFSEVEVDGQSNEAKGDMD